MKQARTARLSEQALLPAAFWLGLILALAAPVAHGAELTPVAINSAGLSGKKSLSREDPTAVGIRLQVLLDRAHFSPGEIDGKFGENAKKALRAYAEAQRLSGSDTLTDEVWKKLTADNAAVLTNYTITEKDVAGPFLQKLPAKMEDMKGIPKLGYTSLREGRMAEKFHMSRSAARRAEPGPALRSRRRLHRGRGHRRSPGGPMPRRRTGWKSTRSNRP